MDQGRSHFGGLAGRVLRGVLSRATLLTGMTLVSCLFLTARGLSTAGRPELFPAAALALVSLGLAFHAARSAAAHGFVLAPTLARTVGVGVRSAMASALSRSFCGPIRTLCSWPPLLDSWLRNAA